MNKIYFIVYSFISIIVYGQHSMPIQMDTIPYKYELIGTGILDYGSTSIQNEMSKKLINGGFISDDIIAQSLNKHKAQNRIGIDGSAEIEFRDYHSRLFNQEKYGYYLRTGYFNALSTAYSKDIFNLIFNGNSSFLGDTANFSGTQAIAMSYQKVGFGFIDKKSKSNFGINYYNISNFSDAFIRSGDLVLDSLGTNIQLDMNGQFRYSNGKKFNKGWGIGLDGDFRIQVKWLAEANAYFQIQIKNIGFMTVRKITEYSADKTYDFSGFQFNTLLSDSANSIGNSTELLDTLGIVRNSKTIYMPLPGFIQLGKVVDNQSNKIIQSFFGIRLHTVLNYTPMAYVGAHIKLYDWMKVGIQTSYGGFSKFRLGFYTQYDLGSFHFGVGSEDLIGAISNKGFGESIHFRISRLW